MPKKAVKRQGTDSKKIYQLNVFPQEQPKLRIYYFVIFSGNPHDVYKISS